MPRHTHGVPTQPRRRKEDGSEIKIFPGLHLHRPLPVPVHGRVRGHGMGLPAPTGGQRGDVPLQLARRQNRGRGGGLCGILPRYPRPAGGKRRPARRESVAPRGTSGRGNSGKREQLAVPLPLHEAGAGRLVAGVLRRDRDRVVGRQRGAVLRHPADAQPRQLLRCRRGNAGGV